MGLLLHRRYISQIRGCDNTHHAFVFVNMPIVKAVGSSFFFITFLKIVLQKCTSRGMEYEYNICNDSKCY